MGVLDRLFPLRRQDPRQILSDDLVGQTQDLLEALIAFRKSRGLTQEQLATRLGITRTAVTHFERYDADPKISTVVRYALATGARITIDVSDGIRWAEDSRAMDRFNADADRPAREVGPSSDASFDAAARSSLRVDSHG
ncbi:helix-turn-helix domain-containing protein [Arthrobacter sp.]|uniref:helix-turn-helix domain-containing protein n=1 Tax=Arthrobacter sp. TaxID=1667 RepID=UPI003A8D78B1